ncbi:hypothetical protein HY933_02650 [Candidatus Falkowbacteria bacterium]|nr:hypothetical protein [Candidatus Falkowbacteria bacterium]
MPELTPPVAASKPLPAPSDLLRASWQLFREHFSPLLKITLVMVAPSLINIGLATLSDLPSAPQTLLGSLIFLFALLSIVTGIWGSVALITYIKNNNRSLTISDAFNQNVSLLWSFFWVGLVVGIITMLAALLLIIPGIIVGVYYSLYSYVMIDQQIKGFRAAATSWALIKGRWWAVFGRLLVIGLLGLVLYAMTIALTWLLPSNLKQLATLLSLIFNLFFSPFAVIYTYRLYASLHDTHAPAAAV